MMQNIIKHETKTSFYILLYFAAGTLKPCGKFNYGWHRNLKTCEPLYSKTIDTVPV